MAESTGPGTRRIEASISRNYVNDEWTTADALGFEPYVQGVADFLCDSDTSAPLTLSVEADWGGGKTSFMRQLEKVLKKDHATVWFDPWRYQNDEALWAAFAMEFLRQTTSRLCWWRRLAGNITLSLVRFDRKMFWPMIKRLMGYLVLVSLLVALYEGGKLLLSAEHIPAWMKVLDGLDPSSPAFPLLKQVKQWMDWAGGYSFVPIAVVWVLAQAKTFFGNPLEQRIRSYINDPGYEERLTFLSTFHEDFAAMVKAYLGDRTVFVFLDDLDRCDPDQATEVLRAINLMITEKPNIVFVIGLDRLKVAAGFAVKHRDVATFVTGKSDERSSLSYGFSFMEKFIQVPFQVPRPTELNLRQFLASLKGGEKRDIPRPDGGMALLNRLGRIATQSSIVLNVAPDSELVHEIAVMVAPALDHNPRRLKQFVNLFRLRAYLARETGLLAEGLTLEQLGKFVAISIQWPLLLDDLRRDSQLLELLADVRTGGLAENDRQRVGAWVKDERLLALIEAGATNSRYVLHGVDVSRLLEISPKVDQKDLGVRAQDSMFGSESATAGLEDRDVRAQETGVAGENTREGQTDHAVRRQDPQAMAGITRAGTPSDTAGSSTQNEHMIFQPPTPEELLAEARGEDRPEEILWRNRPPIVRAKDDGKDSLA